MPKYKVTKVYEVEAASKSEAIEKAQKEPESLMYVSVYLVEEKGWMGQVKQQLTGKK